MFMIFVELRPIHIETFSEVSDKLLHNKLPVMCERMWFFVEYDNILFLVINRDGSMLEEILHWYFLN